MDNDRDRKVRDQAYRIWEEQGRPEGRHEDHWREAEKAFEGDVPDAGAERQAMPRQAPRRRAKAVPPMNGPGPGSRPGTDLPD